jgi:hypothetical protein
VYEAVFEDECEDAFKAACEGVWGDAIANQFSAACTSRALNQVDKRLPRTSSSV